MDQLNICDWKYRVFFEEEVQETVAKFCFNVSPDKKSLG